MEGTIVQLEMKATIDDDPDFVPRVIEEVRAANITDRLVVISFNHDLLRQAKQLMPELKVGVLVYGAVETMALPTSTWEMYVQTLDFKPDWVSCEYHTAYQQPSMVQKLHDLGIKAAYWTVDGEQAVKDLWPLQPDAIVTNRPDRVREWISELEMTE